LFLSEKPVKEKLTLIFLYVAMNSSIFKYVLVTQSLTRGIYAERSTRTPGQVHVLLDSQGAHRPDLNQRGGRGRGG
jgi:hypothetical protein